MFIRNIKQIYDAILNTYQYTENDDPSHVLPQFKDYEVVLRVRSDAAWFNVDHPWGIHYTVRSDNVGLSGSMDEAREELHDFMDWLAELVGAEKPVWEKTWSEKTSDEVAAMSDTELHAEMQVHLKGKPKQGWSRLLGLHGCKVYYYTNGKIKLTKNFYVRDWVSPSDHEVLVALVCANRQQKHDRSEAAKKAAITRKNRKEKKIHGLAMGFVISGIKPEPAHECHCCGKKLKDKESRARGIGPECWTNWLNVVEIITDKSAKEDRS